ncbi:MAG: enoyl-CoA hydratase/isomerase family protein [Deltaproteobacteria bacterium]|nr:enoyl-CoA hydratase/isomerase family protein [Deltaproteobacteria bacterium]
MTELEYTIKGPVAWIAIDREKQGNTISPEVIGLFLDYLDRAEADPKIRAVCITARGNRVFCSGADLGGAMQAEPEEKAALFAGYAGLLARISHFPKPTLARVNGHCLAGGTGFMLACDLVIARDDVLFGTPEVNVGLFPMMIGALIFRNVLRKKAMEMILLGEKLSAAQARDMGMVTRICSEASFDREIDAVLAALTAKSPIGLRLGKQAFNAVEGMALEPALASLAKSLQAVAATRDAAEGILAFKEKRQPVFKGE